jgi:hypothetical protein
MQRIALATLAACLLAGAACSRKPDVKKVEERVRMYWRSCPIVVPDKFEFEAVDAKTVRVSYVLRKQDPKDVARGCLASHASMLKALINDDNPAKFPAGTEFPVIQEFSAK